MSDSSLQARGNAVYQYPPDATFTAMDFSASRGLLLAADANGNLSVNTSTTVPAAAVCLDGNVAGKPSAVGILGGLPGPVWVKLSGPVKPFNRIQQANDGGVAADAGPGNARVVVGALGSLGGNAGDIVPAILTEGNILS